MTIGEAVYAFLSAQPAIAALAGDRILPDMAVQETAYPRIVFYRAGTARGKQLVSRTGLPQSRYTIEAWDLTRKGADNLADAVRQALQAFGELPSPKPPWGTVQVTAMSIEDQASDFTPPQDTSDIGAYRTRLEVNLWHQE